MLVRSLLTTTLALTALGLTACGSDDGSAEPTPAAAPSAGATRSVDAYCALERRVDARWDQAFESLGEDASEAELQEALVELAQDLTEDLIPQGRAAVPADLEADFEVLAGAVEAAADGDTAPIFTRATDRAGKRIDRICYAG